MAALTFVPVGPMAVEQLLVNMRFHFVFFFFRIARGAAGVVLAIGINRGSESNIFSIWRPSENIRAARQRCQFARLSAAHAQYVDLRISVPRGKKCEHLAVRGPRRRSIVTTLGELNSFATRDGHDPNVAGVAIGVCIRSSA